METKKKDDTKKDRKNFKKTQASQDLKSFVERKRKDAEERQLCLCAFRTVTQRDIDGDWAEVVRSMQGANSL